MAAAGGNATGGDINISGATSPPGISYITDATFFNGQGMGSPFGPGGTPGPSGSNGGNASAPGAGGGASYQNVGGSGANGIIIIEEYA